MSLHRFLRRISSNNKREHHGPADGRGEPHRRATAPALFDSANTNGALRSASESAVAQLKNVNNEPTTNGTSSGTPSVIRESGNFASEPTGNGTSSGIPLPTPEP